MSQDEDKSIGILATIGIIPVIWIGLLTAPYLSGGLVEIIMELPKAMEHP